MLVSRKGVPSGLQPCFPLLLVAAWRKRLPAAGAKGQRSNERRSACAASSAPPTDVDDFGRTCSRYELLDVLTPAFQRGAHLRDERMLLINRNDAGKGAGPVSQNFLDRRHR